MRLVSFQPKDKVTEKYIFSGEFRPGAVIHHGSLGDVRKTNYDLENLEFSVINFRYDHHGSLLYYDMMGVIESRPNERYESTYRPDPQYKNLLDHFLSRILNQTPFEIEEVSLTAPLPQVKSIRDFYAFEQHVKTANENRGRDVPKQWYEIPVFYFTNHTAIFGPEDVIPYPVGSERLDYELEVAAVIGKQGRDIPPENAEEYIFGYMIYNDWSARDIQAQEMRVGLGPAKGKDFAQSFGPYLVTPDELADKHTGRPGVYDLAMVARVNGEEKSRGNWKDLHWSFGDMLARASAGVMLYPGDVIGSGTVGTGCLLEITKGQGPYLQAGDVVELEIDRLGVLRNTIGEKQ